MFSDGLNPAKGSAVRGLKNRLFFFFFFSLPGGEKIRTRKLKCIMAFLSCRCDSAGMWVGVRELPCVVAVAAAVVGVCGDVCSCILLHVGGMFFLNVF